MPSKRDALSQRPGGLLEQLSKVERTALASGALQPIATDTVIVVEQGVEFIVRVLTGVAAKDRARTTQGGDRAKRERPPNPFLPPEPDLLVRDLSPTHLAVLNKFSVLDHHLLLVTRAFEEQERLLTCADFAASARCLDEVDGLIFYNGGTTAGASQPHKHLQFVPLPLAGVPTGLPLGALIEAAVAEGRAGRAPLVEFAHAVAPLAGLIGPTLDVAAPRLQKLYRSLLAATGVGVRDSARGELQGMPYNLLLTRRWMMVVPRTAECGAGISVNALGFVGALLVRDARQLAVLRELGPLRLLTAVAPRHAP